MSDYWQKYQVLEGWTSIYKCSAGVLSFDPCVKARPAPALQWTSSIHPWPYRSPHPNRSRPGKNDRDQRAVESNGCPWGKLLQGKTHGESHSENDQTRGGFATSAASLQLHPEHYLRDRGPGSGTVELPTVLLGAFGAVPIGIATQTANYNICRLTRQTKISKITKYAGIWLVMLVEPSGVKQIKQTTTTAKKTINLRHSIFFAKHSSLTLLPFANMGRLRVSASDIFILSTTWQGLCLLSSRPWVVGSFLVFAAEVMFQDLSYYRP